MVFVSSRIPQLMEWMRKSVPEDVAPQEDLDPVPVSPTCASVVDPPKKCKARSHQGNPWLEHWEEGFSPPPELLRMPEFYPLTAPMPEVGLGTTIGIGLEATEALGAWWRIVKDHWAEEDARIHEWGVCLQMVYFHQRRWIAQARRGCPKRLRGYCGARCRDGSECRSLVTPHGTRCYRHGGAKQEKYFTKILAEYEELHHWHVSRYISHAPLTDASDRFEDEGLSSGVRYLDFKRVCRGQHPYSARKREWERNLLQDRIAYYESRGIDCLAHLYRSWLY